MKKGLLYGVAAIVAGILAVTLPDRLLPPEENYRVVSVFGDAFRGFVLGSFRLAMGAFCGLALVAGLAGLRGGGARRPVALVLASLFGMVVIGVSGLLFGGLPDFPADGTIDRRHAWGVRRFARPYRQAVAWASEAPAVRDACGTSLRFGPARDGRNVVEAGLGGWTVHLTLDVEGEKGTARLRMVASLPSTPEDARLVVGGAALETSDRRVELDPEGNAPGR